MLLPVSSCNFAKIVGCAARSCHHSAMHTCDGSRRGNESVFDCWMIIHSTSEHAPEGAIRIDSLDAPVSKQRKALLFAVAECGWLQHAPLAQRWFDNGGTGALFLHVRGLIF